MSVVIETTLGDFTVDLFVDKRPLTCLNFLKLCKLKYYNLCLFHSVNSHFCAQTGDPTGKGDGGESIHGLLKGQNFRFYQGETQPKIKHDKPGLVSMVSHGDGMLGSQFVITLRPDLDSLDGEHCVFGEVVEGFEVLRRLNEAITDEHHRPYQDIRITHTVILEDPYPDPAGMIDPPSSPVPPSTRDVAYSRIPADEPLKDSCTQEELDEMVQAREAAARATILEMVGDLPTADVAPPENVLFVCKLNPVTTDHDLSIIFSRFGKVKSCEVIRDAVTGDSLQYAFVEFEHQKACEEAYFKMDNVLIDDRRIHVDFSQSVAKWRGKGKGVEMLGPTPQGGWGSRKNDRNRWDGRSRETVPFGRDHREIRGEAPMRRGKTDVSDYDTSRMKNGSRKSAPLVKNKVVVKKEIERKKKRRSSSSSSSSDSSDSTSSTESSDSEPLLKKNRRRTKKVLVVVRASREKRQRKKKKGRGKSKRSYSDSEDEPTRKRKKARHQSSSSDSSSEEFAKLKKNKKRVQSSEEDSKPKKRKKAKDYVSSSDSSDDHVSRKKSVKKKTKRRKKSSSSGEEVKRSKRKTASNKKRRKVSSRSETTSSSD